MDENAFDPSHEKSKDDIVITPETHLLTEKCYGCFNEKCCNCMQTFCAECEVRTCKKCYNNTDILCGCYGKCYDCNTDVTRGSKGWPCIKCEKWCFVIFYCSKCSATAHNCIECDISCE